MGCCCKTTTFILLIAAGIGLYHFYPCLFKCHDKLNLETLKVDDWFGHEKLKANQRIPKDSVDVKPFRVNVSDADLNDLQERLKRSRFIDHLQDTNFEYGFNSDYLRVVQQYWLNSYQWRKHEKMINSYPQFITQIEGLNVHFYHIKPKTTTTNKVKTIFPILLVHGWPGSFYEYLKSIPIFTEPDSNGIAYEIILPSIPGYGYSERPHKPGFNIPAAARMFVKLMKRLGHEKFIVHGGDWGAAISLAISTIYPENVRGLNQVGSFFQPSTFCDYRRMLMAYLMPKYYFGTDDWQRQWEKTFPFGEKFKYMLRETGYMHIQATKPDTVAAGLVDSPIGMAAYLLEKFSAWTHSDYMQRSDGGLVNKFTMDELLTNVMIYWTSGNIAASQRFYLENMQNYQLTRSLMQSKVKVPASIIEPAHDIMRTPKKFLEHLYENLLQFTESNVGGHFLAFEEPKIVVENIRQFSKLLLDFEEQKRQEEQKQQQEQQKKHDEV
ncbi:epoxide hydrolase 1-like [Dermatophagoides pteronyssinus]|uniref:epoxide hydrolase 1-like n=1 Tax=Dermatophagoides pteronyssinus TaxID=6956 RepID=UPI003F6642F1